jgi:flagellar biosynthesis/type III secretory pathway ATPase
MNDPIADSVRSILDGHLVLDRELASRGHYPCIDVLNSVSRLMSHLVNPEIQDAAYEIRDLMATYKKSEDIINIGAYKRGSNPRIDTSIARADVIDTFLRQRAEEPSDLPSRTSSSLQLASLKERGDRPRPSRRQYRQRAAGGPDAK